jgi:bacterial/archaeal transporter family protein
MKIMQNWFILALISMFFAGLTSVIAKFGMTGISADLGLAIRTVIVFIFVTLNFFAWQNVKEIGQLTKSNIIFLAISGLTTSLSWIFYYRAIKIGNVSQVALIDKGSIIITLILSFIILKEPVTAKILVGASFILVGLLVLAWK